jgi:hypothetical protein
LQKKGEKSRSSFGAAFLFFTGAVIIFQEAIIACHCERSEAIAPVKRCRSDAIASLRSQ